MKVSMKVNGTAYVNDVEPRTLLVQHLRENLRLTGTHVGCDTSQCGACTIHVNGEAVKACTMFAVQADGSEITTIEGLANDGELHPVQKAFCENHGLQCGYCTPGMIMASVEMLKNNPNPSEEEIRHGLEGNLCRCTGYHNIVKSIKAASEPENQTSDANVTLWEGENKIEVTVRDGADRRTTAVVYIFKDTIGPTYTKGTTIYPTGVYSARQGDPMIFQIDVADASTDVQCCLLYTSPSPRD